MKQSKETTPLWVWLTFGLTSLVIAAYAAVQDEIFAVPDLDNHGDSESDHFRGHAPLAARRKSGYPISAARNQSHG